MATDTFYKSLRKELAERMNKNFADLKYGREKIDEEVISQFFDEILHDFMKDVFEFCNADDYQESDIAMNFYDDYGCDIRSNF